jgi:outer membrane protein assembly factor BamB
MPIALRVAICQVLFSAIVVNPVFAADWLEFRGPTKQGIARAANPPIEWSQTKNVLWRTELPGQGWSSPIVFGKSIFLTGAVATKSEKPSFDLVLFIIDADTGKLLKTQAIFTHEGELTAKMHSKNSQASPTPVCNEQKIYCHFGHLGTACTDLQGNVIWRNSELAYSPVHGNGGSPVVVGDHLIFSRDGEAISEVTALKKQTGKIAWNRERAVEVTKKFSFCTPLVIEAAGKTQLILPGSNIVQSLNPETGDVHWSVQYDGYSVIPRPIYANGLVYVCTGYDRPSLLAIDPTGVGDVTRTHLRWKVDSNVPNTPSLVAYKDNIVMISDRGIASCLDGLSGKEIWKERIGGNFSSSPLLIANRFYLLSEAGEATVLDLDDQHKEIAKNTLGERSLATPAMIDDDFLIRTASALYRISSASAK